MSSTLTGGTNEMNIFVLDLEPSTAAQMLCDKHVVKMILESAQLLCAHFESGIAPYRRTHYNHPCAKWVRKSRKNYWWLLEHAKALCEEYTFRYGKTHKSESVIKWCEDNVDRLAPLPDKGLTEFAQAMPDKYRHALTVKAYRSYYINEKIGICKYTKRPWPYWLKER